MVTPFNHVLLSKYTILSFHINGESEKLGKIPIVKLGYIFSSIGVSF